MLRSRKHFCGHQNTTERSEFFLPYFRLCVKVATALGDLQLAGKCRINVAYNYIWLGQYAEAQRIIRAQVGQTQNLRPTFVSETCYNKCVTEVHDTSRPLMSTPENTSHVWNVRRKKGGVTVDNRYVVCSSGKRTHMLTGKPSRVPVEYRDPMTLYRGRITVPAKDGGS